MNLSSMLSLSLIAEALTRAEDDARAERDYKEWQDMYLKLITDAVNNPKYRDQILKSQPVRLKRISSINPDFIFNSVLTR